ncbi:MAG: MFS transporter [Myxococcota bacterium]
MADAGSRPRLLTPEFWTLTASASVFFLGTSAVNALLPRFVVDELGGSELTAGIVMGSTAISALLTRIGLGRLADRRGARLVILLGAVLATLGLLLLAALPHVPGAILSRLVLGAGSAAVMTASTLRSIELAPESRRSEAASYVLISFHVGMGLGPALGEVLLGFLSYAAVWATLSTVTAAGGGVALFLHSQPKPPSTEPSPLIHRNALAPGMLTLLGVFAFNGFQMFVPLYGREVGLENVGAVFLVSSIAMVVVRIFFGSVPDRIGPVRAGTLALATTVFASLVVAGWAAPAGVFVGAALLSCGLALQSPSFIAIAVQGVPEHQRGSAMATYTAFFDVANALIGPVYGGIVSASGYRSAFLTSGVLSALAIVLLHAIVAQRWRRGVRRAAQGPEAP